MGEEARRVSVVIPTWNGEELLPLVLGSLREQTFKDFEVVVVDNGSTDGSVRLLARDYPEVRVLDFDENLGFSAAVNAGIRATAGEYVALVNNDVELDPGWLWTMVTALDCESRAGFAASRIRRYWQRDTLESAGDCVSISPKGRGHGMQDGPRFDRPAWVTSASAAAAVYRRSLLEEIGLFNEDYFAYFEDVELGMRAQIAGYPCLYVPEAIAYHKGGETSRRITDFRAFYGVRNVVQVYFTTFPPRYILRYLPRLVSAKFWFALSEGGLKVSLRAALSVFRRIPRMIRRRREIFAMRRISPQELTALLDRPRPLSWALLREKIFQYDGSIPRQVRMEEPTGSPGADPLRPSDAVHDAGINVARESNSSRHPGGHP
ncbi:MAG: glycosyltransferase family 2 protein [Dehalococcoidia bacterium]